MIEEVGLCIECENILVDGEVEICKSCLSSYCPCGAKLCVHSECHECEGLCCECKEEANDKARDAYWDRRIEAWKSGDEPIRGRYRGHA